MLTLNKNNNKWQDLEKDEKKYKENGTSGRTKQPYKRDRSPIGWDADLYGDDPYYGEPYDETD